MNILLLLAAPPALAQDTAAPPAPAEDAAPTEESELEQQLAELQARVAELEAQAEAQAMEALLRDAEAMAGAAPPPPPNQIQPLNVFNPRITAFGDVLATYGLHGGEVLPGSGLWLRSLELDIQADVDPFAKAVAVLAVEREAPELEHDHAAEDSHGAEEDSHSAYAAAPEEVYVDLVALPAHFSARLGQFRMPFGITNRAHPHDYPWVDTPQALAPLGEEGLNDAGAVLTYRVHNPWNLAISLQGGVTDGGLFDEDGETAAPGWIGRAEYFDDLGTVDFGLGASATGQGADAITGADLMFRWRVNSWRSVVLLAEGLRDTEGALSGYAALQLQPTRPLYLGMRADALGGDIRYGGYASYYTSEFLRFRVGADYDPTEELLLLQSQLTFVWGSHPVEPYWVNR